MQSNEFSKARKTAHTLRVILGSLLVMTAVATADAKTKTTGSSLGSGGVTTLGATDPGVM